MKQDNQDKWHVKTGVVDIDKFGTTGRGRILWHTIQRDAVIDYYETGSLDFLKPDFHPYDYRITTIPIP